jgi:hypothetical protein
VCWARGGCQRILGACIAAAQAMYAEYERQRGGDSRGVPAAPPMSGRGEGVLVPPTVAHNDHRVVSVQSPLLPLLWSPELAWGAGVFGQGTICNNSFLTNLRVCVGVHCMCGFPGTSLSACMCSRWILQRRKCWWQSKHGWMPPWCTPRTARACARWCEARPPPFSSKARTRRETRSP